MPGTSNELFRPSKIEVDSQLFGFHMGKFLHVAGGIHFPPIVLCH